MRAAIPNPAIQGVCWRTSMRDDIYAYHINGHPHCFIVRKIHEVAKFKRSQIKRKLRLSNMSVSMHHLCKNRDFCKETAAKLMHYERITKRKREKMTKKVGFHFWGEGVLLGALTGIRKRIVLYINRYG